jgi:hypothetical protein
MSYSKGKIEVRTVDWLLLFICFVLSSVLMCLVYESEIAEIELKTTNKKENK